MTSLSTTPQGASPSPYIREATVQNFMAEVVQASLQTPVLVYFTAAWCQPCKQYGPLLEKVVNAAKGKVKLARVDIDKNPQLAQQFRIQSVPMVYVFVQGQPLDGFAGALPESQLKQLIAQIAGAGPEGEIIQATMETAAALLAQGQFEEAGHAYSSILAADSENADAMAGFAKCLIGQGDLEQAGQVLAGVPKEKQSSEAVISAKAALELARSAPKSANLAALQKAAAADPADLKARFDLAQALFAAGRQEEAVNELLAIIARDKHWNEDMARAQLLTFFEALGFENPIAATGRRKLSSLLFA